MESSTIACSSLEANSLRIVRPKYKFRYKKIPVAYLRECFKYENGQAIWLMRPRLHFNSDKAHQVFNARFAGHQAGTFCIHHSGAKYRVVSLRYIEGRCYHISEHQLIWALVTGAWAPDTIDHRDGNMLNNKIGNLRPATTVEQQQNRKMRVDNTSGHIGVYAYGRFQWVAMLTASGVTYRSYHANYEAACRAQEAMKAKYHSFQPIQRKAA